MHFIVIMFNVTPQNNHFATTKRMFRGFIQNTATNIAKLNHKPGYRHNKKPFPSIFILRLAIVDIPLQRKGWFSDKREKHARGTVKHGIPGPKAAIYRPGHEYPLPFTQHNNTDKIKNETKMKKLALMITGLLVSMASMAQDRYTTAKDIAYVSKNDTSAYRRERCKLDVYYPEGKKGFKTIVWFHGGGLEGGGKELRPELQNAGIAIVAPNYRLFPGCKCPDYTRDAAAAVAWTIKHIAEYGGDPKQVYVGGHSAGGYLTLMLALDKSYLAEHGVDADSIKAYYPVGGQTATHYTIRKERKISYTLPIVDKYAPLNNARKLGTRLVIYTGERKLEQMARYEENLYLKAVLEGLGSQPVPLHEINGFDHGNVVTPAGILIREDMKRH